MERLWLFLNNPFARATKTSYERMLTISTFTYAALLADASKSTLSTYYEPFHLAYDAAYQAWKAGGGSQKGASLTLSALLKGLTAPLNDWDYGIQAVYRKGTAGYLALFPNGHAPFLQGKQETRIAAVGSLHSALAGIPPLSTLRSQVENYYNDLIDANDTQKGKMSQTGVLSDVVEDKRIAACNALYYVLGGLMQIYNANTAQIGNYFDLELIRTDVQDDFRGSIAPATHKTIVKRTLAPDDEIGLSNTGAVPLTFYAAAVKDGPLPPEATGVTLIAGGETTVPASHLGDVVANKFVSVTNSSELAEGTWEVEL